MDNIKKTLIQTEEDAAAQENNQTNIQEVCSGGKISADNLDEGTLMKKGSSDEERPKQAPPEFTQQRQSSNLSEQVDNLIGNWIVSSPPSTLTPSTITDIPSQDPTNAQQQSDNTAANNATSAPPLGGNTSSAPHLVGNTSAAPPPPPPPRRFSIDTDYSAPEVMPELPELDDDTAVLLWQEWFSVGIGAFEEALNLLFRSFSTRVPILYIVQLMLSFFTNFTCCVGANAAALLSHLNILYGLSSGMKVVDCVDAHPGTQPATVVWVVGESGCGKTFLQDKFDNILRTFIEERSYRYFHIERSRVIDPKFITQTSCGVGNYVILLDEGKKTLPGLSSWTDKSQITRFSKTAGNLVTLASRRDGATNCTGLVLVNVQPSPALQIITHSFTNNCRDLDIVNNAARYMWAFYPRSAPATTVSASQQTEATNEIKDTYCRVYGEAWPETTVLTRSALLLKSRIQDQIQIDRQKYCNDHAMAESLHMLYNRSMDNIYRLAACIQIWACCSEEARSLLECYSKHYMDADIAKALPSCPQAARAEFAQDCTVSITGGVTAPMLMSAFGIWSWQMRQYTVLMEQMAVACRLVPKLKELKDIVTRCGKVHLNNMQVQEELGVQKILFTAAAFTKANRVWTLATIKAYAKDFGCFEVLTEGITRVRQSREAVALLSPSGWSMSAKYWRALRIAVGGTQERLQTQFNALYNKVKNHDGKGQKRKTPAPDE